LTGQSSAAVRFTEIKIKDKNHGEEEKTIDDKQSESRQLDGRAQP
jgi:hypothetical protein